MRTWSTLCFWVNAHLVLVTKYRHPLFTSL
jgi:hypothetical protein